MNALVHAILLLPKNALIGMVKAYRLLLSPWLGSACRFSPTCSVYATDALTQHGAVVGSTLTAYRLARCQPWCQGGHDPVPVTTLFTRLWAQGAPTASSPSNEKTTP
jgi:putative membrane protein insertion efficiency factor